MSQWVRSEKKVSLETIKLSTTSPPLVYLLHYCLHMQVSDMKSQPGLFVIIISGPAAILLTTCIPRRIAFPDTL